MGTLDNTKAIDISGYVKRLEDGAIDARATTEQFNQALSALIATERADNDVIAVAVRKAFSDRNAEVLGMNAILHYTMENLDVDPTNFNLVRDRVAGYIRANQKEYGVSKGRGGGVKWNMHPTHAPTNTPSQPPSSNSIRPRSLHAV